MVGSHKCKPRAVTNFEPSCFEHTSFPMLMLPLSLNSSESRKGIGTSVRWPGLRWPCPPSFFRRSKCILHHHAKLLYQTFLTLSCEAAGHSVCRRVHRPTPSRQTDGPPIVPNVRASVPVVWLEVYGTARHGHSDYYHGHGRKPLCRGFDGTGMQQHFWAVGRFSPVNAHDPEDRDSA